MIPNFGAEYEANNELAKEAAQEERDRDNQTFTRYQVSVWLQRLLEKNTRRLCYCKDRCDALADAMMTASADRGPKYIESLRIELCDKRNLTGELKGNIAGLKYALKNMDRLKGG